MKHRWVLAVVCLLLCGGVVLARQGIVRTHDGRTIEGVVEEEADQVLVTIRGIVTTIPREEVASIEYPGTVEDQFQRRRAALAEDDVEGRVELARWAFDQRQYRLAADVLEEGLRINPNHAEANALLTTVRGQIRLEATRRPLLPGDPPRPIPDRPVRPQIERQLLSPDQINIIRQMEMRDPADAAVRVRFENNVQRRYVDLHPITPREFNAMRPAEQARLIMADPELRHDVRIASDPAAMAEFRRTVQPLILSGCAASGCHSGGGAGEFILLPSDGTEQTAYTNFMILQQYTRQIENDGAMFRAARRYMIDRTQPEQSLLLQYGLPRNVAQEPHPEVPGMRPPYMSREDRNYRTILNWISRSLNPVQPNYGIDFTPPQPMAPQEPVPELGAGRNAEPPR